MNDDNFFQSKIKSKKQVSNQVYVITEDLDAYQFVNIDSSKIKDNKNYYCYWAHPSVCYVKDGDITCMIYFPNYLVLTEEDIKKLSFSKSFDINTPYKYEKASQTSFDEFYKNLGAEIMDTQINLDCYLGMSNEHQDLKINKKLILSIHENQFSFNWEQNIQ